MLKGKPFIIAMLGALLFVIIMFSAIEVLKWVATSNQKITAGETVYKVVQKDDEGYWYACEAQRAEDGTYVPNSYYGKEDQCVVYVDENVITQMPKINDLVTISMNKFNEEPHVSIARE